MLNINLENLENLYMGLIIKLVFSFIPLLLLPLIPNKDEIENDMDLRRLNGPGDDNK